ncbi:Helicase loader DnaI [uncultured Candidatus Thioglobus sp.]|nr:Helicase loader DnaI [uncultured Candidatus Thioglobus sp.]
MYSDLIIKVIVTDYRLNANHNLLDAVKILSSIVTDYRLNANHNFGFAL